jgi:hypothetical protein
VDLLVNVPVGITVIALTPFLLRESRANLGARLFDLAGATVDHGGLMLLVYAMTCARRSTLGTAVTALLSLSALGVCPESTTRGSGDLPGSARACAAVRLNACARRGDSKRARAPA